MKTMPDSSRVQAASFDRTASADAPVRFVNRNLQRIWELRRMQAMLLRPFRRVLRPLLHWIRQEHFYVKDGRQGVPPAGLKLKQFGWETLALGIILGPLAFLMLLPLLIVIFPVVVIIGLAASVISTLQTDAEDTEHHSLTWHAMH